MALLSWSSESWTGDTPSELDVCPFLGPLLDISPDSDAPEPAELAAASRRSVNPPRLDRAGMATTFVPPSAADTPPLVALNVKGDGVADALAEDIAMRERGGKGESRSEPQYG